MLWLGIKRDKNRIDVVVDGVKRMSIRVDQQNRGNCAILSLESDKNVRFKIEKEAGITDISEIDENKYNSEVYNV